MRDLQLEAKQLFDEYIVTPKPILLTATESRSFDSTTICHICTKCETIVTLHEIIVVMLTKSVI